MAYAGPVGGEVMKLTNKPLVICGMAEGGR
jgi:hypothetical protein